MRVLKQTYRFVVAALFVLLFTALVAACSVSPATPEATAEMEMDHALVDAEQDMEHEHGDRLPNEGAAITISSPADGSTFARGEDIVVEVEVENFELNVDGSHWHIYIDGTSYGMVVGNVTKEVLRNLEPGEHEIAAYLAYGTHEELEDGGIIHITVEE